MGAGRPLARCGREAGGAALPAWVRRGCCCCWDAWRRSCRLPAPPSSARPWTATSPSRCRPAGRSASTSLCARRPRWSSSTRSGGRGLVGPSESGRDSAVSFRGSSTRPEPLSRPSGGRRNEGCRGAAGLWGAARPRCGTGEGRSLHCCFFLVLYLIGSFVCAIRSYVAIL